MIINYYIVQGEIMSIDTEILQTVSTMPQSLKISGRNCNTNYWNGLTINTHRIWSGTYIIEFDQPFAGEPAVISTIYGNEWQTFDKSIAIVELDSRYFVPVTSSMDRPEDCAFTFIAFGDV